VTTAEGEQNLDFLFTFKNSVDMQPKLQRSCLTTHVGSSATQRALGRRARAMTDMHMPDMLIYYKIHVFMLQISSPSFDIFFRLFLCVLFWSHTIIYSACSGRELTLFVRHLTSQGGHLRANVHQRRIHAIFYGWQPATPA
jgi:hypothetical protein